MSEVYDQDIDAEFITGIQFRDGMMISEIIATLNDSSDYAMDAVRDANVTDNEELMRLGTVVWLERAMQVSVFSDFPLLAEVEVHRQRPRLGICCSW